MARAKISPHHLCEVGKTYARQNWEGQAKVGWGKIVIPKKEESCMKRERERERAKSKEIKEKRNLV